MPLTPLNSLHLLVHPLCVGDPRAPQTLSGREEMLYAVQARLLSFRYMDRAASLGPADAMILFSHLSDQDLRERGDPYARTLRGFMERLDGRLGRRLFRFPLCPEVFEDFRAIGRWRGEARLRGFDAAPGMKTRAYGETFLHCVRLIAANFHEGLDLAAPTQVEVGLTEAAFWWHRTDEEGKDYVRSVFLPSGLALNESIPELAREDDPDSQVQPKRGVSTQDPELRLARKRR
ncbi:MAG TPA: hypothetical protein VLJ37_09470 [bacterium]|nr:hypothetical protein [bacterium]